MASTTLPDSDLTLQQESFCHVYIEERRSISDAYRAAYKTENMLPTTVNSEASRLFKLPHIAARILELQEEHRERHHVTVDSLSEELDEARDEGKKLGQTATMVAATMGKGKLHGLIADKVKAELTGAGGQPLIPTTFNIKFVK